MARSKRPIVDDAITPATQRLNVQIESTAYERLVIHCLKSKKAPGEMVTELINANLRQWRLQANDTVRVGGKHRLDSDAQANDTAAA
ncbi:MAG: hypothetical protein ABSH35_13020 [Isosphaeraceae bacterium]|jgi:hypothetical protein